MADNAKRRVKNEKKVLDERIEKLSNLPGKVKSDNWQEHQKLLESLSKEQK